MDEPATEEALHRGRAAVLADLTADGVAGPAEVSQLEEAVAHRRWWAAQWPAGAAFVPGLLAQDMQDALLETRGRWPLCPRCVGADPHALLVEPELGEDPHWVCPISGEPLAPVGRLGEARP
ncbi:hypothetical protein RM844_17670 [Streptomyces sp. DSM 44915]|uniref:Uncharacterized protein n=1 Tax=Streptomyces chisholmiae TaxID=3075540 RepID=A0ABU2JUB6_9ACTN|nr:hypothetical protein [Streptomyces sp. DSM 44915]MDT0268114.1 hypothetical protein [Streptomyces sp. DSM 44915]